MVINTLQCYLLLCTKPFLAKEHRKRLISCRHVLMRRNKVNNKLSCRVTQRCRSYCTFCFAVISNVTFFGNSTESGQIDRNSQRVVLRFSGNNVSASITNNFFMSNMNLVCGLNSITCQAKKKIKFHRCSFLNINVKQMCTDFVL